MVDVAAGEDMKILNAAEGGNPSTFDIIQGFVQYAGGPLTVIAGKYMTLAGRKSLPHWQQQFLPLIAVLRRTPDPHRHSRQLCA